MDGDRTSVTSADGASAPSAASFGAGDRLATASFLAVAFAFHLWLEFTGPGLHGVDGYFHVKLAHLYRTGEASIFASDFPWTTCSSFNDLRCDWQLGYHLLLVPFTLAGMLVGGKVATALFAALVPTVVYAILRAERAFRPFVWGVVVLLAADYYLVRVHLPRPTSPVIALLLLATWAAARERFRAFALAIVAMLGVYAVPHNALAVVVVAAAALALAGRWRSIGALVGWAALAVVVGTLAHPGFWNWRGSFFSSGHALFDVWEQMSGSLAASDAGDRILIDGEWVPMLAPIEFRPPGLDAVVEEFPLVLGVFAVAVVFGLAALRRRRAVVLAACGMSAAYLVLFLQHTRFAEYWVPFTALAAGLTVGDARAGFGGGARSRMEAALVTSATIAAPLVLVATLLLARGVLDDARGTLAEGAGIGLEYEGAMTWIAENTEEDAIVFHARWPQFSPMFYFDHRNRYLIGLDSYFFYQHDPAKYRTWMRIGGGEVEPDEACRSIREEFGARHAFAKRGTDIDIVLNRARKALVMYEDANFRVYAIDE